MRIDFSRPIIITCKIRKVCLRCYRATPGSRKPLSVSPPCSTMAHTAAVELMCPEVHRRRFTVPAFSLTIRVICPYLGSGQGRFFFSNYYRKDPYSNMTESLVCKESHVLLCAVMPGDHAECPGQLTGKTSN